MSAIVSHSVFTHQSEQQCHKLLSIQAEVAVAHAQMLEFQAMVGTMFSVFQEKDDEIARLNSEISGQRELESYLREQVRDATATAVAKEKEVEDLKENLQAMQETLYVKLEKVAELQEELSDAHTNPSPQPSKRKAVLNKWFSASKAATTAGAAAGSPSQSLSKATPAHSTATPKKCAGCRAEGQTSSQLRDQVGTLTEVITKMDKRASEQEKAIALYAQTSERHAQCSTALQLQLEERQQTIDALRRQIEQFASAATPSGLQSRQLGLAHSPREAVAVPTKRSASEEAIAIPSPHTAPETPEVRTRDAAGDPEGTGTSRAATSRSRSPSGSTTPPSGCRERNAAQVAAGAASPRRAQSMAGDSISSSRSSSPKTAPDHPTAPETTPRRAQSMAGDSLSSSRSSSSHEAMETAPDHPTASATTPGRAHPSTGPTSPRHPTAPRVGPESAPCAHNSEAGAEEIPKHTSGVTPGHDGVAVACDSTTKQREEGECTLNMSNGSSADRREWVEGTHTEHVGMSSESTTGRREEGEVTHTDRVDMSNESTTGRREEGEVTHPKRLCMSNESTTGRRKEGEVTHTELDDMSSESDTDRREEGGGTNTENVDEPSPRRAVEAAHGSVSTDQREEDEGTNGMPNESNADRHEEGGTATAHVNVSNESNPDRRENGEDTHTGIVEGTHVELSNASSPDRLEEGGTGTEHVDVSIESNPDRLEEGGTDTEQVDVSNESSPDRLEEGGTGTEHVDVPIGSSKRREVDAVPSKHARSVDFTNSVSDATSGAVLAGGSGLACALPVGGDRCCGGGGGGVTTGNSDSLHLNSVDSGGDDAGRSGATSGGGRMIAGRSDLDGEETAGEVVGRRGGDDADCATPAVGERLVAGAGRSDVLSHSGEYASALCGGGELAVSISGESDGVGDATGGSDSDGVPRAGGEPTRGCGGGAADGLSLSGEGGGSASDCVPRPSAVIRGGGGAADSGESAALPPTTSDGGCSETLVCNDRGADVLPPTTSDGGCSETLVCNDRGADVLPPTTSDGGCPETLVCGDGGPGVLPPATSDEVCEDTFVCGGEDAGTVPPNSRGGERGETLVCGDGSSSAGDGGACVGGAAGRGCGGGDGDERIRDVCSLSAASDGVRSPTTTTARENHGSCDSRMLPETSISRASRSIAWMMEGSSSDEDE